MEEDGRQDGGQLLHSPRAGLGLVFASFDDDGCWLGSVVVLVLLCESPTRLKLLGGLASELLDLSTGASSGQNFSVSRVVDWLEDWTVSEVSVSRSVSLLSVATFAAGLAGSCEVHGRRFR